MKIDFKADPKHARDYVVLDRTTGEEIDDAIFYADDEEGVYHAYLWDRAAAGGMAYRRDDATGGVAWREVRRPIRIELKGRVDPARPVAELPAKAPVG